MLVVYLTLKMDLFSKSIFGTNVLSLLYAQKLKIFGSILRAQ